MSSIPIVQGVAVGDGKSDYQQQHHTSTTTSNYHNEGGSSSSGGGGGNYYQGIPASSEHHDAPATTTHSGIIVDPDQLQQLRQDPIQQYQDAVWAVAFLLHLVAMIAVIVAGMVSSSSSSSSNNNNEAAAEGGASLSGSIVVLVAASGFVAVALSVAALSFMMRHTETLVQTALLFSVATSLAVGVLGFLTGSVLMGCLGLLSFAVGVCYARIVWPRIPFAAANLGAALACVQCNLGLSALSLMVTAVAFGWTVLWFLGVGHALESSNAVVLFLLFLSYYWVHQVLQNTLHVTTAGVVGTWWWAPFEANSFWSQALTDSWVRACTYSFGSICFGSLLVAVVQALRALEYHSRSHDDLQFLACIIQCILACIQSIIEELNRWAYVYVGLYGFPYLQAGRNVIELFKAKGWTVIISDDLADNVLFMMTVAIGLASGLAGLVIGLIDPNMFASLGLENAAGPAFGVGFLTGFLFASILMSVVASAVNTVIVCYAEDPAAFQMNHPHLSSKMREAWVQAWPGLVT